MLLRAGAVHLTDVMADEVLLVEHGVVGAQEVVTLTEEAVVVDLREREREREKEINTLTLE